MVARPVLVGFPQTFQRTTGSEYVACLLLLYLRPHSEHMSGCCKRNRAWHRSVLYDTRLERLYIIVLYSQISKNTCNIYLLRVYSRNTTNGLSCTCTWKNTFVALIREAYGPQLGAKRQRRKKGKIKWTLLWAVWWKFGISGQFLGVVSNTDFSTNLSSWYHLTVSKKQTSVAWQSYKVFFPTL